GTLAPGRPATLRTLEPNISGTRHRGRAGGRGGSGAQVSGTTGRGPTDRGGAGRGPAERGPARRPAGRGPDGTDGRGEADGQEGIRLQKVLAAAGVGSRRHNEELIDAGRVRVDGKVVREQGRRVDPETAVIEVDGERVVTRTGLVHLALNKPRGVVSTMADPEGRPTISDLLT